jgi:hypothetical protein
MFFLLHQNVCWSQSAPLSSVGNDCEVGKRVGQFGVPNGVKSLMRRSPGETTVARNFLELRHFQEISWKCRRENHGQQLSVKNGEEARISQPRADV